MPFDDVHGYPKPSGVAAAAATAADVARSVAETPDERHDAATCCGERQELDVGEGWRELGPEEIIIAGDEVDVRCDDPQWVPASLVGRLAGEKGYRYRRRVTPVVQPLGAFIDEENNTLRAENAALRSEVERLRLVGSDSQILKRAAQLMCDHEPHFLFSINSMLGVADKLDGKSVALEVERTVGGS